MKIWGLNEKLMVSNENLGVFKENLKENLGSPMNLFWSSIKIWGSAMKIWGLNKKLMVSNANLGVSNEKFYWSVSIRQKSRITPNAR